MLINITYANKETDKQIADVVGRPYTLIEKIRMRGVGTSKMQIVEADEKMAELLNISVDTKYCYFELRTKGLIIGFQSISKTYVWVIPFYSLSIYYNGGLLSIYSNTDFMKVKKPFYGSVDKKYLKKVLDCKAKYFEESDFRNEE